MFCQNKYRFIAMLLLLLAGSLRASGEDCLPVKEALTENEKGFLPPSDYVHDDAILPLTILFANANLVVKSAETEGSEEIHWKLLPEFLGDRITGQITCEPEPSRRRIKDFLAMAMSGLVGGKNNVFGQCFGGKNKECYLEINHRNGEAVYSYSIRFKTKGEKILPNTVWCINTP